YLAHLGLVVTVVGGAACHFGQQEKDVTLTPGESVTVAGYTLTFTGSEQRQLLDDAERVAGMRCGGRTRAPSRATHSALGRQHLFPAAPVVVCPLLNTPPGPRLPPSSPRRSP